MNTGPGQSHFLPMGDGSELHLRHFPGAGDRVLLLHGAIENGRIFYSRSGRGLAPWLAERGFDVWVMDLGGRGESRPAIARDPRYGQTRSIVREIPAVMDWLEAQRPERPCHWLSHSWGGVLMTAVLARFPAYRQRVASLCHFGSKRRVRVWNWQRLLYVDLIWCGLSPLITAVAGYLPARRLGFGSDDESRLSFSQGKAWVRQSRWVDPQDGFDYGEALKEAVLPPSLYLAGRGDRALGHPADVQRLMEESGRGEKHFMLLSKASGQAHDYGHIDMLTAPEAMADHFPLVQAWMQDRSPS